MRVKLRAEAAGLQSVSVEAGQIALRYPALSDGMSQRMFSDLGPGIRGGKNTYWCSFLRDDDWTDRLLAVLDELSQRVVEVVEAKLLPG
jgi:transcription-repair coupling factor (superfamily II helicase)